MSSFNSIEDVIRDLKQERRRIHTIHKGLTIENSDDIYIDSWQALNSWIESRLINRKGAHIPQFGSFTWEFKENGSQIMFRPLFIMEDSFVRDHKLKRPRIHMIPQLAPSEEINFSSLAIKFSKKQTKSSIFTGVRDIVKKISEFIDKYPEFKLPFSFGTLSGKDRRVRFDFNQTRLQKVIHFILFREFIDCCLSDSPGKYI